MSWTYFKPDLVSIRENVLVVRCLPQVPPIVATHVGLRRVDQGAMILNETDAPRGRTLNPD
jgi:hypothetical protein